MGLLNESNMFSLTAATINLRNRSDRWLARRRLLVSELIDHAPDIVSFQEISLAIGQASWLVRQVNIRLSGSSRGPYSLVQERRRSTSHWMEGVGVMTKLPIQYHDVLSLGYDGRIALRVNVALPPEQTHGRHASLDFVAVHLHHQAEDSDIRLQQSMQMVGWLNDVRRVPLQVIAGDFNEVPKGAAIQFMKQSYHSAYETVHDHEPLATFPTFLIQPPPTWAGCIDYVFVSPAVYKVRSAALFCDQAAPEDETLYPSDHVGLIVGLEV